MTSDNTIADTAGNRMDLMAPHHDSRKAYRARMACLILRIFVGTAGMPPYAEPGSPQSHPGPSRNPGT